MSLISRILFQLIPFLAVLLVPPQALSQSPDLPLPIESNSDPARIRLSWVNEEMEQLELDWRTQLRWIWRRVNQDGNKVLAPFAQLWIALPPQFADSTLPNKLIQSAWIRDKNEDSPFFKNEDVSRNLILETQSPLSTLSLTRPSSDTQGEQREGTLKIQIKAPSQQILIHPSCGEADAKLDLESPSKSFFFLGQYCFYTRQSVRAFVLWPSADLEPYEIDADVSPLDDGLLFNYPNVGNYRQVQLRSVSNNQSLTVSISPPHPRLQTADPRILSAEARFAQHHGRHPSLTPPLIMWDLAALASDKSRGASLNLAVRSFSKTHFWSLGGQFTETFPATKTEPETSLLFLRNDHLLFESPSLLLTGGLGLGYVKFQYQDHLEQGIGPVFRLNGSILDQNYILKSIQFSWNALQVDASNILFLAGFDGGTTPGSSIELLAGMQRQSAKFFTGDRYTILVGIRIIR